MGALSGGDWLAALLGTMLMNPAYVGVFLQYFLPTMIIVLIMLKSITILKACLFIIKSVSEKLTGGNRCACAEY